MWPIPHSAKRNDTLQLALIVWQIENYDRIGKNTRGAQESRECVKNSCWVDKSQKQKQINRIA